MELTKGFTRHQFFLFLNDEQVKDENLLANWLRGISEQYNMLFVLLIIIVEVVFDKVGVGVVYRLWIDL